MNDLLMIEHYSLIRASKRFDLIIHLLHNNTPIISQYPHQMRDEIRV